MTYRFSRIFAVLLVMMFVLIALPLTVFATGNTSTSVVVTIPDANLNKAIRAKINKPTGTIYSSDLAGLVDFTCFNADIKDLTGLGYATNLKDLRLDDNEIASLQPIASLSNLEILCVQNNHISSLEPLRNLHKLKNINCMINNIHDLSPIVGLTSLTDLTMDCNPIDELPIGFSNLTNLQVLWADDTGISDLTQLGSLTQLQMVLLNCNGITDITPLKNCTQMVNLQFEFNHITDLTPLANMPKLSWLDLTYNGISDISALAKCTGLNTLVLTMNAVRDISPLASCQKLWQLELTGNQLTDTCLPTLNKTRSLRYAHLEANQITRLDGFRSLPFTQNTPVSIDLSGYFLTNNTNTLEGTTPKAFDPVNMAIEQKLRHLGEKYITAGMSDLEKVLAVHDFIVKNATYSVTDGAYAGASSILMNHAGFCSTYSNITEDLLSSAGIVSRPIGGAGHAWNMVQVDGKFYHLDTTWDDNYDTSYRYDYFLLSDDAIQQKRSGDEFDWTNIQSGLKWYKDVPCDSERFAALDQILQNYHDTTHKMLVMGGYVYYIDNGRLYRTSVNGGTAQEIVSGSCDAVLKENNSLVISDDNGSYFSLNADGSNRQPVHYLFAATSEPEQCFNNFPVNGSMKITFNDSISSVQSSQIKLMDTMGQFVPITASVSDNVLIIKPKQQLLGLQEYTLSIPATALSGKSGYSLQSTYTLYFSTAESPNEIPEPDINKLSGLYSSKSISVTIHRKVGETIHYTLDGSIPTNSSLLYQSSIQINKPTILRYYVQNSSGYQSKIYTQIYNILYYTVTFNSQNGPAVSSQTAYQSTIPEPKTPVRPGYEFAGWFKDSTCSKPWIFDSDMVNCNITLYAKWNMTTPGIVNELKATSASYDSIRLTWKAVPFATGYSIYRSASFDKPLVRYASTTSVGYLDTGLVTGNTYYYVVRAFRQDGSQTLVGPLYTTVSVESVPATPKVTVNPNQYNSLKISWNTITGTTQYQIYRATAESGPYSLLATTPMTNYINDGLTCGKRYYYKVRSYHLEGKEKIYGSFSGILSGVPVPATPANAKANRASSTSITVTWQSVPGATGYEITRSLAKNGTYTAVKTTSSVSWISTGLKTGTAYYYKIRAYRLVGTTKLYGGYSAIAYATP